ncbi:MAG: ATP-binding protein [Clostridia bacterium]|nr:ATP-binding protein [Clostridia bacterium]
METDTRTLYDGLLSLVIFRDLRQSPLISAALQLMRAEDHDRDAALTAYAELAGAIYDGGGSITACVDALLCAADNDYIRKSAAGEPIPACMQAQCLVELDALSALSRLTSARAASFYNGDAVLAQWTTDNTDIRANFLARLARIDAVGYGIFAAYTSFLLREGSLVPVLHPDPIRLEDLKGYERERRQVIDNTAALLAGKPAQNVLLSGDAGTGKSSAVKAIANHFAPRGLRLIQLEKQQLRELPALMGELSRNPLKFILFVDDLSFSENDDDFGALKAALEGSVSARSANTAIYVTSNRRHLIRERFSDRDGDEIHHNDTVQELTSLSDRFGLTVTYVKPDKQKYLAIVCALADAAGLAYDRDRLCAEAEIFATRKGGRSPRAARQFMDTMLALK